MYENMTMKEMLEHMSVKSIFRKYLDGNVSVAEVEKLRAYDRAHTLSEQVAYRKEAISEVEGYYENYLDYVNGLGTKTDEELTIFFQEEHRAMTAMQTEEIELPKDEDVQLTDKFSQEIRRFQELSLVDLMD